MIRRTAARVISRSYARAISSPASQFSLEQVGRLGIRRDERQQLMRADRIGVLGRHLEHAPRREPLVLDEPRRAAGQVHDLADQVGVDLGDELVEVQIEVVEPRAELRGVVVAQVRRVEMLEVRRGADERALASSTSSRRRRSGSRGCGPSSAG